MAAEQTAEPGAPAPDANGVRGAVAICAALYAVAAVVYLVLAHRQAMPIVEPDEFNYGRVARSIADGDGKTLLGAPYELKSALYLYTVAPAWLGASTTTAYGLAKAISTLLLCLTVVPTWLLARELLAPRAAIVPAVLVLAGTWMMTGAHVITENLALPLSTASFAAMVVAVRAPGSRWGWVSLGLAAIATWARFQCVALVPVLFLALVARALLTPSTARERLKQDRWLVAATGGFTAVGGILALARPSVMGSYAGLADFHPSIVRLLSAAGHQGIALAAMTAILPVILVLAASARRTSWRDDDLAALLVVTWAASLVIIVESAWLITGFGAYHVQRYVEYVVPLLLVAAALIAQRRAATWRGVAGATALVAALLLPAPGIRNLIEETGAYGIWHRLDQVVGVSLPLALAIAAVVVGAAGAAVLARARDQQAVFGIGAILLVILLMQSQAGWHWQLDRSQAKRDGFPADLAWVDHATSGPVAGLIITTVSSQWLETSFFNRSITSVYAPTGGRPPSLDGRTCPWGIQDTGYLVFGQDCGAAPRRFLVDDPFGRPTFYDQSVTVGNRFAGRLVTVPGQPRMRAVLQIPCAPLGGKSTEFDRAGEVTQSSVCLPALSGQFWLDTPGTLIVRFRGGSTAQTATTGSRTLRIAPNALTTIRVPVAAGANGVRLTLSWKGPSPALAGAVLVQRGRRTPLL